MGRRVPLRTMLTAPPAIPDSGASQFFRVPQKNKEAGVVRQECAPHGDGPDAPVRVARAAGFIWAELENGVVLMSEQTGSYFALNQTASVLWQLLEEPEDFDALCERLMKRFAVDRARCRAEVWSVIVRLRKYGAVCVTPVAVSR